MQADRASITGRSGKDRAGKHEKEARLVLNELWAKVSAREKFVAYGAVAVLVGWILGQILGSSTVGGYNSNGFNFPGVTINYFGWGNAGSLEILALLAAIVVAVVLYLKVAPNMNITWPLPVGQILLGAAGVSLVAGALATLIQVTNGGNPPVMMYLCDVLVVGGGAAMTWFSYQEFLASKTAV
jgi:hypothetical protein